MISVHYTIAGTSIADHIGSLPVHYTTEVNEEEDFKKIVKHLEDRLVIKARLAG